MKVGRFITAFLVTMLLLLFFEMMATAIIPALGIVKYRPLFYMLIVIFLAFKLETPLLPLMILSIQWLHSAFTIEGWAIGTFAGILTSIAIGSLKDLMHFNSKFVTMVSVQLLLFFWFIVESVLLYVKVEEFRYIVERFKLFFPESIVLAIISPFIFSILDRLWKDPEEDKMGVDV
ncbi:MAG: hypothetical protein HQK50_10495 [Oligoflexia bacterium]|nr:hypothetical protein [Oligoflexia bacterium]MBF0365989.1 hypothetical protein [Oligoflexia bacterium]